MINSITLPSGKVFKIPIFDAWTANDLEKKTRANGAFLDVDSEGHLHFYQNMTYDDIIALARVITGQTISTISTIQKPYRGYLIGALAWHYNDDNNEYRLEHPFSVSNGELSLNGYMRSAANSNGMPFYASYNQYYPEGRKDFTDNLVYLRTYGTPGQRRTFNFRPGYVCSFDVAMDKDASWFTFGALSINETTLMANIAAYNVNYPDAPIDYTVPSGDYTDPYGNIISSGAGGGDGEYPDPEHIEKATIPALPTVSAVDAGMITMYYATSAQLQALSAYLWANLYDLETNFVKLFASPMDCIIGLSIVPVMPSIAGGANVKFGNITTSVSMSKLSTQYVELDCGSVKVQKFVGCFMDYTQTKISIYLPYIGFRDLDPADVMGETLHVVYHIDCLTGGCCAFIECSTKGLLYSYNGSCIANVPVTAINYSGAIQNAVSAISNVGSFVGNVASGNVAGVVGNVAEAANTALNSKPTIQRSGNMGGAPGIMAYQKPMLVIERPRMCVPNNLNHFKGNTLYVTRKLSQCLGFTQIDMINLDGVPCTRTERKELESILKEGVYF